MPCYIPVWSSNFKTIISFDSQLTSIFIFYFHHFPCYCVQSCFLILPLSLIMPNSTTPDKDTFMKDPDNKSNTSKHSRLSKAEMQVKKRDFLRGYTYIYIFYSVRVLVWGHKTRRIQNMRLLTHLYVFSPYFIDTMLSVKRIYHTLCLI